jgi:hypothetical protein
VKRTGNPGSHLAFQFLDGVAIPWDVNEFASQCAYTFSAVASVRWGVHPYSQRGINTFTIITEPDTWVVRRLGRTESYFAALPEPRDHLSGGTEPAVKRSQPLNQPHVKVAPESLWTVASVVPQDRQHATEVAGIFDQNLAALFSIGLREVKFPRIEQSTILDVQRQFQKL